MPPKFIFFDLGNVLLNFDREIGFRALAEEGGSTSDRVRAAIMESGVLWRYEEGKLDRRRFYEYVREEAGLRLAEDCFHRLHSQIFRLNVSIVPIVAQLVGAGHRVGLLSNICDTHWEYCSSGRYGLIPGVFEKCVLSYAVGAIKPDPKIFAAAAAQAGVRPTEIFFTDDTPGHVEGARRAGWDAVHFASAQELARQLQERGLLFNY